MNHQHDQVQCVDEHNTPTNVMDKLEAHRGDGKRHRAVSVFLLNSTGELLIQKRSAKKIVGALQWANTCCGNVWPGETYEQCAQRRLRKELGITRAKIMPAYTFEYHLRCNDKYSEWEMDRIFVGRYRGKLTLDPEEVLDALYISQEKLEINMRNNPEDFSPWFHLILRDPRLREAIGWRRDAKIQ
ncbi:MAG: isopentenyl-diphosphate Delta-isomerase [Candidatus Pacebacteria bacterium]|nr:isopentenyl-diphosphate Delta-isomerase [Candidatus Paceibacterota bacterium]